MKANVSFGIVLVMAVVLIGVTGCVSLDEHKKVLARSMDLKARVQDLELAQETQQMRATGLQHECDRLTAENEGHRKKVAELYALVDKHLAAIARLSEQVGQVALPEELSDALSEWALRTGSALVSYDPQTGIVRFKSDLLFKKGEDVVQPDAAAQVQSLAAILNSSSAQGFDILIMGHTDDIPIEKPGTKAKHPTNWHLSAHRAISVQKILAQANVDQRRTAVLGCGEFRPMVPNKAGHRGNPRNRRVEIYIVPSDVLPFRAKSPKN